MRSTDGIHFSGFARFVKPTTLSCIDRRIAPNHTYYYEIKGVNLSLLSPASSPTSATTRLTSPLGLSISAVGSSNVQLTWTPAPLATGYAILRSTDSTHFSKIAQIKSQSTYSDTAVTNGTKYFYEIQAISGTTTSIASAPVTATPTAIAVITISLMSPISLAAVATGPTSVALSWLNIEPRATGYNILRSANGSQFTFLKAISNSAVTNYTDGSVVAGGTYSYEVESYNNSSTSAASAAVMTATPLPTPTVLNAPTLLSTNAISSTQIQLAWTDNDAGATGYYVLRSTDGTHFTTISMLASASASTYTDSQVSTGTAYTYEIEAFNSSTTSTTSNAASTITPLLAPSSLAIAASSGSAVQLGWIDNDGNASGYLVLRSTDGVHFSQIATVTSATANTYTDSQISTGTTYSYEVQAINSVVQSPASNSASTTTPLTPPSGLTILSSSPVGVDLGWTNNDTNATGYIVLRSTDGVTFSQMATVNSATATSFNDSKTSTATTYFYEVEASNNLTTSAASSAVTATIPLSAPSSLVTTMAVSGIEVSWANNDSNAAGFYVLRATDGINFTQVGSTDASTTSYTDTNAATGTSYSYEVQAFAGPFTSSASNPVSTTTSLVAPSSLTITGSTSAGVQLSWTNNDANATGYLVLRSTDGEHFTQITTLTSGTSKSFVDTTINTGTSYSYEVEAYNSTTTSVGSNVATTITPLSAPATLALTSVTASTVQLSWVDQDSNATGYYVLRSTDGVHYTQIATVTLANANSFTDATVSSGTRYSYAVEAYDSATTSVGSNTVLTITPLAPPSGLTATSATGSTVQLAWTDNDANGTGYLILRSSDRVHFSQIAAIASAAANSFSDNTVTTGTAYTYSVEVYNGNTTSNSSNWSLTTTPLSAPSALGVTASTTANVQLFWTDNDTNATGYSVLRSTDGIHFSQIAALTSGNASTYTDATIATGTSYSYEVEANDALITSLASNPVVTITPLAAPSGLSVTAATTTQVQLSWTNSDPNASEYDILRSTDGIHFAQIAVLTSRTANTFSDTTIKSGSSYNYQVEAANSNTTSAGSNTVATVTPLAAPSSLAASASPNSVQLSWSNNDASATGYAVLRSTDGGLHFSQIGNLTSANANSYTDSTVISGASYVYAVEASDASITSPASNSVTVVTPLVAPASLAVTGATTANVSLTWSDKDSNASGYYILRSTNGVNFSQIAKLTPGTANSYVDATTSTGVNYTYEVQAYNAVTQSGISNTTSATTPLKAPSALSITTSNSSQVGLSWTDNDSNATAYYVLRKTGSGTFATIATLTSSTASIYTDASVNPSTTYTYEIQAYNGLTTSGISNMANVSTPAAVNPVTLSTRFGNELVISATGASDTVSISQSNGSLSIVADGQTFTQATPTGGTFVYNRGGADTFTIATSVTSLVYIVSLGQPTTKITGSGTNVEAWYDSTDTFTGTGIGHSIASFAGGVSKSLGASLPVPTDSGATTVRNFSLFGTGPSAADAIQGYSGDCYLICSLASFANQNANLLLNSAVDLGDGTYAVEFQTSTYNIYTRTYVITPTYVRVNNSFPSSGNSWVYAAPGTNNTIWVPVFEKAFAYFRDSLNTYQSISSGTPAEVYGDFALNAQQFIPTSYTDATMYSLLSSELTAGKPVTLETLNPPNLVASHCYTLMSVKNVGGVNYYVVRNPWGHSGSTLENSQGIATLTFAQLAANFDVGDYVP